MAADKLHVYIEAGQTPTIADVPVIDDIRVADTFNQSRVEGLWLEPYTKSLTIKPLQFSDDFYKDDTVTRYGKSAWTLTSDYWDEIEREEDRYLLSNGTDELIETTATFDANVGFVLDFFLYGHDGDEFEALNLTFGGWTAKIWATGRIELYFANETVPRAISRLVTPQARHGICDHRSQLVIMPSADNTLYIRRNGAAGLSYKLPAATLTANNDNIIDEATFTLKAPNSQIQFQLTQLAFPIGAGDYYWISPNRQLPKPIPADTELATVVDELNLGGSCIVNVYEAREDSDGFDDLVVLEPDGVKDSYCVGVLMSANASGTNAPLFRGVRFSFEPAQPEALTDPSEITSDVTACRIEVTDDPMQTAATVTIRNPDDHDLLGACNCRAMLKIGTTTIFDGVLKEPARRVKNSENEDRWELSIQTLAKYLDLPCLPGSVFFDGQKHTDVIKWLCGFAGLPADYIETDTDDMTLRDTRKMVSGKVHSDLQPSAADTPRQWIEKVAAESCWTFLDGPLSGGGFGLRYIDPLTASEDSDGSFVYRTQDSQGEAYYDILRSDLQLYSIEPEGNEIHFICPQEDGTLVSYAYKDEDSQNPDLAPEERPDNWLGIRKVITIPVNGIVPDALGKRLAWRVGRQMTLRVDMAEFEADWWPGLWRGSVVELNDNSQGYPGAGKYRIETMSLQFESEAPDYPIRRARYSAVKLEEGLAVAARRTGDLKLARDIGNWIRYGRPNQVIQARQGIDTPGMNDQGNKLDWTAPVKAVVWVTTDPEAA